MNTQEAFTKAYIHLLSQGTKAHDPVEMQCAYRGQNGTMCAVGCLIPDDLYNKEMEGLQVWKILNSYTDIKKLFSDVNVEMLHQLQNIHDFSPASVWPSRLELLAGRFGLTIPKSPEIDLLILKITQEPELAGT
jgi:hypothetical protein